jgi:hypothetical protein
MPPKKKIVEKKFGENPESDDEPFTDSDSDEEAVSKQIRERAKKEKALQKQAAAVSTGETKTATAQSTSLEYPDATELFNYSSGYRDIHGRPIPFVIYKGNPMPLSEYKVLYKKHNPPKRIVYYLNKYNGHIGKMIEPPNSSSMAKVEVKNKDKESFLKESQFSSYITFWPLKAMQECAYRKEGGRKYKKKRKSKTHCRRKRKRKRTKRRAPKRQRAMKRRRATKRRTTKRQRTTKKKRATKR